MKKCYPLQSMKERGQIRTLAFLSYLTAQLGGQRTLMLGFICLIRTSFQQDLWFDFLTVADRPRHSGSHFPAAPLGALEIFHISKEASLQFLREWIPQANSVYLQIERVFLRQRWPLQPQTSLFIWVKGVFCEGMTS